MSFKESLPTIGLIAAGVSILSFSIASCNSQPGECSNLIKSWAAINHDKVIVQRIDNILKDNKISIYECSTFNNFVIDYKQNIKSNQDIAEIRKLMK